MLASLESCLTWHGHLISRMVLDEALRALLEDSSFHSRFHDWSGSWKKSMMVEVYVYLNRETIT